jgi:predicted ATP-dependent serine protease
MENAITSLKTCFKCGQSKTRDCFYKHSKMSDGLLGKCKECTKKDALQHRLSNINKIRQYDRERAKNPERAKKAKEISDAWRKEDSRRSSVHSKVARAIRKGEIKKKPCCICGSEKSMAHHESYDKPLDIVWYCQVHHKQRHKEMILSEIYP